MAEIQKTSFPKGMPLPRLAVRPMTLATKAFRVKYSFRTTPRRIVFSSGIPEPTYMFRNKEGRKRERKKKGVT